MASSHNYMCWLGSGVKGVKGARRKAKWAEPIQGQTTIWCEMAVWLVQTAVSPWNGRLAKMAILSLFFFFFPRSFPLRLKLFLSFPWVFSPITRSLVSYTWVFVGQNHPWLTSSLSSQSQSHICIYNACNAVNRTGQYWALWATSIDSGITCSQWVSNSSWWASSSHDLALCSFLSLALFPFFLFVSVLPKQCETLFTFICF